MKFTRSVLSDITICSDGSIGIRLMKELVTVGKDKADIQEPHRVIVGWYDDIRTVSNNQIIPLQDMDYPWDQADVDRTIALAQSVRDLALADPEIKSKFDSLNSKRQLELDEQNAKLQSLEQAVLDNAMKA